MSKKETEISTTQPLQIFTEHNSEVRCLYVENDFLYSGGFGNQIMKHKMTSDSLEKIWEAKTTSYVFSLTIHLGDLYSTGSDIRCFKTSTGNLNWSYKTESTSYLYTGIGYKSWLLIGGDDKYLRKFEIKKSGLYPLQKEFNTFSIWGLKIYNDRLYSSDEHGDIKEWDLNTLQTLRVFSANDMGIWAMEIIDSVIYSCGKNGSIQKWDLETGKKKDRFEEVQKAIISSYSDQDLLFTAGYSGVVFCFDIKTEKCIAKFQTDKDNWCVIVLKNRLIAGTVSHKLYMFDLSNLVPWTCLSQDFQNLFTRQELCDCTISTLGGSFGIHKYFVNSRLKIDDIDKYKQIFSSKIIEEATEFFDWVYSGVTKKEDLISEFLRQMKIKNNFEKINDRQSLSNDLKKIYQDDSTKDFTIFVQGKPIKVHKFILLARTDLYRGMFLSVTEDKSNQVNDYSGNSFETVHALIEFLYFAELKKGLKKSVLNELIDAPNYYQLNENTKLLLQIKNNRK
ncbi:di- and tripeptidase dug2-related [Anaeramoeba ignava]|uniref:Di- and tripeptidase dug2-related n=1 Tax=Anaeramoeba ignava TaxID=1746090 RepID=A0A9Q0LRT0_ANAIG|nr:di- and tripeptidase dug2-related [Anaeramoeba ignava]